MVFLNYFLQRISLDLYSFINFISLFLIYLALNSDLTTKELTIITFLFGLLNDSLSSTPLGLSTSSFLISIFVILKIKENFVFTRTKDKAFLGMSAIFIKSLMDILFYSFFEYKVNINYLNRLVIKPIIYLVLLYLILFFTNSGEEEKRDGY